MPEPTVEERLAAIDEQALSRHRQGWAMELSLLPTASLYRRELAAALKREAALRAALVKSVVPYEALLADEASRQWIAPSIWQMMADFRGTVRALLAAAQEGGKGASS